MAETKDVNSVVSTTTDSPDSPKPIIKEKASINKLKWVSLNVGGKIFTTTLMSLNKEPNCMLARMFHQDDDETNHMTPSSTDSTGAYLIDRSPQYFEPILNYLRHGQLIIDPNLNPQGVLEEARFFGIETLVQLLESSISVNINEIEDVPLTRRDVVAALIQTSHMSELRFQGVNMAGADLQKLDLRNINFKYACFQRCNLSMANLSGTCIERANFTYANLEYAQLLAVRGVCANFEGCNLQSCNFEDPSGVRTNLEGVNLKNACLEGSNCAGVNLRVANLKGANLKNCNLRSAVLAGADLERCNLSGSDLQEANLRGANFKDAELQLMLTPLHMSQAIR